MPGGNGGGDDENKCESEEQRKKRKVVEHQGQQITIYQEEASREPPKEPKVEISINCSIPTSQQNEWKFDMDKVIHKIQKYH